MLSSSLIGQLIAFVRSVVLARLLAPEDFGLFGMALTIVAALNALTTIGLERTIVANKFDTRKSSKHTWTQCGRRNSLEVSSSL